MKTMKLGDTIIRVAEKDVNSYLNRGYGYCPKSEWKATVRDLNRVLAEEKAAKKEAAKAEAKEAKEKKAEKKAEKKDTRQEDKKKQKDAKKGKK